MTFRIFLLIAIAITGVQCANFEERELQGTWENEKWRFEFNPDGTCKVGENGRTLNGDFNYRTFINTIEITRNNRVFLTNLTIKELVPNEKLTLEFRELIGSENGIYPIELKSVK